MKKQIAQKIPVWVVGNIASVWEIEAWVSRAWCAPLRMCWLPRLTNTLADHQTGILWSHESPPIVCFPRSRIYTWEKCSQEMTWVNACTNSCHVIFTHVWMKKIFMDEMISVNACRAEKGDRDSGDVIETGWGSTFLLPKGKTERSKPFNTFTIRATKQEQSILTTMSEWASEWVCKCIYIYMCVCVDMAI